MDKLKKIIFDFETKINTRPSKWIFLLGILFVLSIIL
jgi:hypothetical protein|tara:strand:- start:254 stop:364 length:111 start_codon:yes stop_codon:yes gene_type:complete